jgi:hypothetical protein
VWQASGLPEKTKAATIRRGSMLFSQTRDSNPTAVVEQGVVPAVVKKLTAGLSLAHGHR